MSLNNFTPQQLQAIHFQEGHCVVSAGAGSGKTAVLTERVYWLLVPPLDERFAKEYKEKHGVEWSPDDKETPPVFQENVAPKATPRELVVLTFTNAAAFEMKERVRVKLANHEATKHLLASFEESDITTFDSFNLRLVNENHYALGLDSEVSVLDEGFVKVYKQRLIRELTESYFERALRGEEPYFANFVDKTSNKDYKNLYSFIKRVLTVAELSDDPIAFLSAYKDNYETDEWLNHRFNELEAHIRNYLERAKAIFQKYEDGYLSNLDIAFVDALLNCRSFDEMHGQISGGLKFPVKPKGVGSESDVNIRNGAKAALIGPVISYLASDKAALLEEVKQTFPYVDFGIEIALDVEKRLMDFMKSHASYSFPFIASLALKALNIDSVLNKIKNRYRFVMVDEYQDTSDIQESLLRKLDNGNFFAVGDIKQSIYRFRNANPRIFLNRVNECREGKGKLITLPDNFRSRKEVIDDINDIFLKIMKKDAGGVNYEDNHALAPSNRSYDLTSSQEAYGLSVIDYEKDPSVQDSLTSARVIVKDIADKVAKGFRVHTKEGGRPCEYGDFAVLISRKSGFSNYVRAFKEAGIPLSLMDSSDIRKDDVYLLIKSLISLVEMIVAEEVDLNKTKYFIASIARSFLFDYEDKVLYEAIKNNTYEDFPFYKKLKEEKCLLKSKGPLGVFDYLSDSFNFLEGLTRLGDIKENLSKLLSIRDMAKTIENLGMGLSDYLDYLSDFDEFDFKLEVSVGTREKSAVALMSMHKSKGLQFKICYYPELYAKPNSDKDPVKGNKDLGMVAPYFDGGSRKNTFLGDLYSDRDKAEERNEKMRLFYVALTRAEEKMIVLVPKEDIDEKTGEREERKLPPDSSLAGTMLDFFLLSKKNCPHVDASAIDSVSVSSSSEAPTSEEKIEFKSVRVAYQEKESRRASKELSEPLDPGKLIFGTRLHRFMEFASFKDKALPECTPEKERKILQRVLELPLFKDADKAIEFHEYDFDDEEFGNGSIDCFLLYDDHIDLIDFKTRSIDENAYSNQLSVYEKVLSKAFPNKRIDKYLLSLALCEAKRVS